MERAATHNNARPQSAWTLPEELHQLALDGGAEVVADVIAVFQEDSAARLIRLREAVRTSDYKAIRAEGHALKGSSSQLGASDMASLCFQMEQMGVTGNAANAPGLLVQIEQNFAEVSAAMSKVNWGDGEYDG